MLYTMSICVSCIFLFINLYISPAKINLCLCVHCVFQMCSIYVWACWFEFFINMIVVHAHSQYLAHVLLQALVHIILNDLIQQIYIEGCVQQTHISNRRKTISSRCRLKHKHIKHKDSYANHCRNMRKHTQNIINLCKTSRIMRLKI